MHCTFNDFTPVSAGGHVFQTKKDVVFTTSHKAGHFFRLFYFDRCSCVLFPEEWLKFFDIFLVVCLLANLNLNGLYLISIRIAVACEFSVSVALALARLINIYTVCPFFSFTFAVCFVGNFSFWTLELAM